MIDRNPDLREHVLTVSGRDHHSQLSSLFLELRPLLAGRQQSDRAQESGSVVPFQADGQSIVDLIQRLVGDMLQAVADSPTELDDMELANVIVTDEGVRAWGHLWFGTRERGGAPPSISVAPIAGLDKHIRLTVRHVLPDRGQRDPIAGDCGLS